MTRRANLCLVHRATPVTSRLARLIEAYLETALPQTHNRHLLAHHLPSQPREQTRPTRADPARGWTRASPPSFPPWDVEGDPERHLCREQVRAGWLWRRQTPQLLSKRGSTGAGRQPPARHCLPDQRDREDSAQIHRVGTSGHWDIPRLGKSSRYWRPCPSAGRNGGEKKKEGRWHLTNWWPICKLGHLIPSLDRKHLAVQSGSLGGSDGRDSGRKSRRSPLLGSPRCAVCRRGTPGQQTDMFSSPTSLSRAPDPKVWAKSATKKSIQSPTPTLILTSVPTLVHSGHKVYVTWNRKGANKKWKEI